MCIRDRIKRLEKLGAKLLEGPIQVPDGPLIAFIKGPIDVRIELLQYTYEKIFLLIIKFGIIINSHKKYPYIKEFSDALYFNLSHYC